MNRRARLGAIAVIMFGFTAQSGFADEIENQQKIRLHNQVDRTLEFQLRTTDGRPWSKTHKIAPDERQSIKWSKTMQIRFAAAGTSKIYTISSGVVYRFAVRGGKTGLFRVEKRTVAKPVATPTAPGGDSEDRSDSDRAGADARRTLKLAAPGEQTSAVARNRIREITVIALADDSYRGLMPRWRDDIKKRIAGASQYYERNFDIRLVLKKTREWNYSPLHDRPDDRWKKLLQESPEDADLVVAFIWHLGEFRGPSGKVFDTGTLGRAGFFGQHVMVSDQPDKGWRFATTILIHELGHVFGAFHVNDPALIMQPSYMGLPLGAIISGKVPFGDELSQIIRLTRDHYDFRQGIDSLEPEVRQRIQSVFESCDARIGTDPITLGIKYRKSLEPSQP